MQSRTHVLMLMAFGLMLAVACKKNDAAPTIAPITVSVQTAYDTSTGNYAFPAKGITVTLKNTITGSTLVQSTNDSAKAIFSTVSAGVYDAAATITIGKAQYQSITGSLLESDSVILSASLSGLTLNGTSNNNLKLALQLGVIGDWVIKQIYYAGSNTSNGATFRDQFIEIYNNSNKVLYADSLYVAQLDGNNTTLTATDMTKSYFLSDASEALYKQFDWGKSLTVTSGDNAWKNFVYAKTLFRVPGNGTTYPIQPGQSFVIAATAQNHKAPYVGTDGIAISVKDPSLTIDLRDAEFEVYLGGTISNPLVSDVDNLNVPNMIVIDRASGRDLVLDALGRDAIAIFKTTASIPVYGDSTTAKGYQKYPEPSVTTITSSTAVYFQIPNDVIIDAVQMQHPSASSRVPRKLANSLDSGPTNVPDGQYTSESLIRKTAKTVSGRRILMDTNNSANDFDYFLLATPKGFKN